MPCASCNSCLGTGISIKDTIRLQWPFITNSLSNKSGSCSKRQSCGIQELMPRCRRRCPVESCCDRYKRYWSKNPEIPCIRCYEEQPWIRDPCIKLGWAEFVADYVTPKNICCHLQPGPNDHRFKCNKVRALMGPQVSCTWDLPCQEEWYENCPNINL